MTLNLKAGSQTGLVAAAAQAANAVGLYKMNARTKFVLDRTQSMEDLYANGQVQRVCQRVLGLAINLDDSRRVPTYLFNTKSLRLEHDLTPADFENFVARRIRPTYKIIGKTSYAPVINHVIEDAKKEKGPTYVIFVTDGRNDDADAAREALITSVEYPIFFQFIGIGREDFNFLKQADRFLPNASFFALDREMADGEIYQQMLKKFSTWVQGK